MERLPSRVFVFIDAFATSNDGIAYQFGDTCRNGAWNTTTHPADKEVSVSRRHEKLPRWWRVVHRKGKGWDGYLFRERNRDRRSAIGTTSLKGVKLPQAVTDKLAAIALLTCHDKPIDDL